MKTPGYSWFGLTAKVVNGKLGRQVILILEILSLGGVKVLNDFGRVPGGIVDGMRHSPKWIGDVRDPALIIVGKMSFFTIRVFDNSQLAFGIVG